MEEQMTPEMAPDLTLNTDSAATQEVTPEVTPPGLTISPSLEKALGNTETDEGKDLPDTGDSLPGQENIVEQPPASTWEEGTKVEQQENGNYTDKQAAGAVNGTSTENAGIAHNTAPEPVRTEATPAHVEPQEPVIIREQHAPRPAISASAAAQLQFPMLTGVKGATDLVFTITD